VRCDNCGHAAPDLKTVACRGDLDRRGVLCDPCWLHLRDRLWVVPGAVPCFGRCRSCGEWFSVRELSDRKPGGGHGAMIGVCVDCAE